MTHDLGDKFAVLTDDRPEPIDPAALVRTGITRTRRRRRATAAGLTTAAVTTVALTAAPVAGALLRTDAPVGGGPATTATDQPATGMDKPLPGTHQSYPVAHGQVGKQTWQVTVGKGGCLSSIEGNLRPATPGRMNEALEAPREDCLKQGVTALSGLQETPDGPIIILAGTTSSAVHKVRITADGRTLKADTVATPVSGKHRFFAVAYKADDVGKWSFTPIR